MTESWSVTVLLSFFIPPEGKHFFNVDILIQLACLPIESIKVPTCKVVSGV